MTYFTLTVDYPDNTSAELDFQCTEFGISNAVFQALAARQDVQQCTLYGRTNDGTLVKICDKTEWLAALRTHNSKSDLITPKGVLM